MSGPFVRLCTAYMKQSESECPFMFKRHWYWEGKEKELQQQPHVTITYISLEIPFFASPERNLQSFNYEGTRDFECSASDYNS
jgi:hypothetical protein